MNCSYCLSLMIEEQSLDFAGSYGQIWTASWRCINCNRAHRPIIEPKRHAKQTIRLTLSSDEPDYHDDEVHLGSEAFIRYAV